MPLSATLSATECATECLCVPLSAVECLACRYVANAERTEERLSAEIGRLCGVVEHLKLEMARQVRSPLMTMMRRSGASQARDGAPGAISLDDDEEEEWSISSSRWRAWCDL